WHGPVPGPLRRGCQASRSQGKPRASVAASVYLHPISQQPTNNVTGTLRSRHRTDLKIDQVVPLRNPLLEQARLVALHELKAALQVYLKPAIEVFHPLRQHASLLAEAAVNGGGVPVPKALDHHEEHRRGSCVLAVKPSRGSCGTASRCVRISD